jgi:pseudouridine-5'-phosphate glycosidase
VEGPAVTPWLLARVAELTDGASVRANVSLIANNARVAGRLAVELGRV